MSAHEKTLFLIFLTGSTFAITITAHLPDWKETKHAQLNKAARSESEFRRDEVFFSQDLKNLRRDLRRHLSSAAIAQDRRDVREDWMNIIEDRDPRGPQSNDWLIALARRQRRSEASMRDS